MFREAAPIGKLDVQLCYYRGDECRASKWLRSGEQLAQLMNKIECEAGVTQIGRVLGHALREHEKAAVQALTFIGDAFEEELETVAAMAGKLGTLRCPIFMFQDVSQRRDATARNAFRLLALKSGGAYFEFNPNKSRAIEQLSEQLNAVARLAVGDVGSFWRVLVEQLRYRVKPHDPPANHCPRTARTRPSASAYRSLKQQEPTLTSQIMDRSSLKRLSSGNLIGFFGHVFTKSRKIKSSFQIIYHLHDGRYIIQDYADGKQTPMTEADLHEPNIKLYRAEKAWHDAWGVPRRVSKHEPPPWE